MKTAGHLVVVCFFQGFLGATMLETEIIKLLNKISKQLEEIALSQSEIKSDVKTLYGELREFQEYTLKFLEDKIANDNMSTMLN